MPKFTDAPTDRAELMEGIRTARMNCARMKAALLFAEMPECGERPAMRKVDDETLVTDALRREWAWQHNRMEQLQGFGNNK